MSKSHSTKALWACAVAAGAAFLPWLTMTTFIGTINISGMVGDGKVSLVLAIIAALMVMRGRLRGARVFAWVGVVYAFGEYASIQSRINQLDADVARADIGIGVYLTAVGFIGAVVFITKAIRARKAATAMLFLPPSVPV